MPDLVFASQSLVDRYVQFRPCPPRDLVNEIVQYAKKELGELNLVVDVGCGSGQSSRLFSSLAQQVVGIDVSREQVQTATRLETKHNVKYAYGVAEKLPFADSTVDLVVVFAALHFFDLNVFYAEVKRVLRPGGVLAACGYKGCDPVINGRSMRGAFLQIWHRLDEYWTEGHSLLDLEYRTLPKCFPESHYIGTSSNHYHEESGGLDDVLGYVSSWSAFSKMQKDKGEEEADKFLKWAKQHLETAAGDAPQSGQIIHRRHRYFCSMWRKSSEK